MFQQAVEPALSERIASVGKIKTTPASQSQLARNN